VGSGSENVAFAFAVLKEIDVTCAMFCVMLLRVAGCVHYMYVPKQPSPI
jgi:hypothetical protein